MPYQIGGSPSATSDVAEVVGGVEEVLRGPQGVGRAGGGQRGPVDGEHLVADELHDGAAAVEDGAGDVLVEPVEQTGEHRRGEPRRSRCEAPQSQKKVTTRMWTPVSSPAPTVSSWRGDGVRHVARRAAPSDAWPR